MWSSLDSHSRYHKAHNLQINLEAKRFNVALIEDDGKEKNLSGASDENGFIIKAFLPIH